MRSKTDVCIPITITVIMRLEYSTSECKLGTTLRKVYLYEDDGDVIMTDEIMYEDDPP
jgi:hypothetical protein